MSNFFSNKNQFINYYKYYNIEDFEDDYNILDDPLKKIKLLIIMNKTKPFYSKY